MRVLLSSSSFPIERPEIDPDSPLPCELGGNLDTSGVLSICGGFAQVVVVVYNVILDDYFYCRPGVLHEEASEEERQGCHDNKFGLCFSGRIAYYSLYFMVWYMHFDARY